MSKHHILLSCRFMLCCVFLISDVHSCFGIFDCESDRNQPYVSNLSVYLPLCVTTRRMKKTNLLYTTFYYRKPSLGYRYTNSFSYFWNAQPNNGLSRATETCSFLDYYNKVLSWYVGPCHHGMARPQFADGGTASSMEGSCEYIE
jgi:hypothetical protein